jgi:hypothetical protein
MHSDIKKPLIITLLAWMLALVLLTALYNTSLRNRKPTQREFLAGMLPVYPGAYQVERGESEGGRWGRVAYLVDEDYPSEAVLAYYRSALTMLGWTEWQMGRPRWLVTRNGEKVRAILETNWNDASELRTITVRLQWDGIYRGGLGRQMVEAKPGGSPMRVTCVLAPNYVPSADKIDATPEGRTPPPPARPPLSDDR